MSANTPSDRRALVMMEFLVDDDARRVALSWPLIPPEMRGLKMHRRWAALAGVNLGRLELLAKMLQGHKICLPNRTLDPEAVKVLEHMAATAFRKRQRRR